MINIGSHFIRSVWIVLLTIPCFNVHADDKSLPCNDDSMFQQQDFTLGHWDVYAADQKTAEVHLEKALKGCAIQETWKPVSDKPGNGLGLFTYSRLLKSWGYFWVADTGQTTAFTGTLQSPGTMLYVTETPLVEGGKRLRHWSLILQTDGTIRELAVGTNDGKHWTTDYDLLWRRKK